MAVDQVGEREHTNPNSILYLPDTNIFINHRERVEIPNGPSIIISDVEVHTEGNPKSVCRVFETETPAVMHIGIFGGWYGSNRFQSDTTAINLLQRCPEMRVISFSIPGISGHPLPQSERTEAKAGKVHLDVLAEFGIDTLDVAFMQSEGTRIGLYMLANRLDFVRTLILQGLPLKPEHINPLVRMAGLILSSRRSYNFTAQHHPNLFKLIASTTADFKRMDAKLRKETFDGINREASHGDSVVDFLKILMTEDVTDMLQILGNPNSPNIVITDGSSGDLIKIEITRQLAKTIAEICGEKFLGLDEHTGHGHALIVTAPDEIAKLIYEAAIGTYMPKNQSPRNGKPSRRWNPPII